MIPVSHRPLGPTTSESRVDAKRGPSLYLLSLTCWKGYMACLSSPLWAKPFGLVQLFTQTHDGVAAVQDEEPWDYRRTDRVLGGPLHTIYLNIRDVIKSIHKPTPVTSRVRTNLIKGFKVELLEEGIPFLHLHPPCGPELHHQLIPLCRAEPVGVRRLQTTKNTPTLNISYRRAN